MKDLTMIEIFSNINQKHDEPIYCRIQRLCEKNNITIGELSTKLGIFDFNENLTIKELRIISRYFGCSIEHIVNGNFDNLDNMHLGWLFNICNEYMDNFDSELIDFNTNMKNPLTMDGKSYMMKVSVRISPSKRNIKPGTLDVSCKTESIEENDQQDYNCKGVIINE